MHNADVKSKVLVELDVLARSEDDALDKVIDMLNTHRRQPDLADWRIVAANDVYRPAAAELQLRRKGH